MLQLTSQRRVSGLGCYRLLIRSMSSIMVVSRCRDLLLMWPRQLMRASNWRPEYSWHTDTAATTKMTRIVMITSMMMMMTTTTTWCQIHRLLPPKCSSSYLTHVLEYKHGCAYYNPYTVLLLVSMWMQPNHHHQHTTFCTTPPVWYLPRTPEFVEQHFVLFPNAQPTARKHRMLLSPVYIRCIKFTNLVIIYPRFKLCLRQIISFDVDFNELTARDWPTTTQDVITSKWCCYNKWNITWISFELWLGSVIARTSDSQSTDCELKPPGHPLLG